MIAISGFSVRIENSDIYTYAEYKNYIADYDLGSVIVHQKDGRKLKIFHVSSFYWQKLYNHATDKEVHSLKTKHGHHWEK